jgi:hypothetical protein
MRRDWKQRVNSGDGKQVLLTPMEEKELFVILTKIPSSAKLCDERGAQRGKT